MGTMGTQEPVPFRPRSHKAEIISFDAVWASYPSYNFHTQAAVLRCDKAPSPKSRGKV
jgi:hypothetical protein